MAHLCESAGHNRFREIAPNLPRHAITPARFVYLRRELLEWGKDR